MSEINFEIKLIKVFVRYFPWYCKKNENSHLEIWNGPNNGGFFVQMGAYNSFARIAMDQAIEATANKDT